MTSRFKSVQTTPEAGKSVIDCLYIRACKQVFDEVFSGKRQMNSVFERLFHPGIFKVKCLKEPAINLSRSTPNNNEQE